ncbi:hypothetical protein LSCM1_07618 [Leishmania martiniquensis]|uniref:Uncharacterized protein n=1 Tax=Leishmania martiniquensis TaxID=1580590 RepID=A0A836GP39_9TRYP|nr:hypothetical protein LSCM1_07618 [Leishmania martiniquensis]
MSSNAAENSVEKEVADKSTATTVTVDAGASVSNERGWKGWRNRLMNWRSGGGSSHSNNDSREGGDHSKEAVAASDVAAKNNEEHDQQSAEVDRPSVTASTVSSAVADAKADSTAVSTPPARPMNIWLRRALERQVESAIAEAIRDGKPIPEAAVEASADTPPQVAAGEPGSSGTATSAKMSAVTPAAPKTSFAELMRRHREGLVPPSAQPPVKATKVVKRPKGTESPHPVVARTAPEEAPEQASAKKRAAITSTDPHSVPEATPVVSSPLQATPTAEADPAAAPSEVATVHQAAVRKRPKATNSASAKRAQGTSATASVIAAPAHVTMVKGKASLEELRARRNRTTAGGSVGHHNTPATAEGGRSGVESSSGAGNAVGEQLQQDEYSDSALDAVSRLLLRYCLGSRTTATAPSTAAATDGADVSSSSAEPAAAAAAESPPSSPQMTTEIDFLNELMELFESNSLTPASLELLRELFQHVRVLPRPLSVSGASKSDESADAGASASQDGEATTAEMDADAYREAARRREYVQQVIMVLLNRLKHMKIQEQRQKQQNSGAATAATSTNVASSPAQPTPAVINWISTTKCAPMPPPTRHQQQLSGMVYPIGQRMSSAAPWPSMAEAAGAYPDEVAAAAFTSAMTAYGYPNPYAHLTVFSQHQPVAPPVGWLSSFASPIPGAPHDCHGNITHNNSNVAARLVASPFPGAFPIIPPPANMDTAGAEDREMQELFRMIRAQLTQPVSKKSSSMSAIGTRAEASTSVAGATPVEVSQAERAVLRHVQLDFKKHMEQQQAAAAAAAVEGPPVLPSPPQTASTQPTAGLSTPPEIGATQLRRTHATPGATAGTPDPAAGGVTGTTAAEKAYSGQCQHHHAPFAHQVRSLERTKEAAGGSPSEGVTIALVEKEAIAASEAAPAKPHRTTLSLNATPFVPGGATTATFTLTPTADSTPKKTTFNYHAKPFLPAGSVHSSVPIVPPNRVQPAASAQGLAPQQKPQRQRTVSSSAAPFLPKNLLPANTFQTNTPVMPPPPPGSAADPWASYEMFARWRDMMENYYQQVFAMQRMSATATVLPSPSPTDAGGGPALAAMITMPRPA